MTRPSTPPETTATGSRRLTVKRACDRCDRELGDATKEELETAMLGAPLPSVVAECGCLAADAAIAALEGHHIAVLLPYPEPHWECECGADLGDIATTATAALTPHHVLLAREAVFITINKEP